MYVCNRGVNSLYRNNGDGTFTEVTNTAGVGDAGQSTGVAWGDFDNDGYIDLYVCESGSPNLLYRNLGDGTFTNVANTANCSGGGGDSRAVEWGDYNDDGWLDILVTNYNSSPAINLYKNNGDGTFTNVSLQVGVGAGGKFLTAVWGDLNNDGFMDIIAVGYYVSALYLNKGDGTFEPYADSSGFTNLANEDMHGVICGDYNLDGFTDIAISHLNGVKIIKNSKDLILRNFTSLSGIRFTDDAQAIAWGDYDSDGFPDLYICNYNGPNALYHNNGNLNNWLQIRLIGKISNKSAIGAKVKIKAH